MSGFVLLPVPPFELCHFVLTRVVFKYSARRGGHTRGDCWRSGLARNFTARTSSRTLGGKTTTMRSGQNSMETHSSGLAMVSQKGRLLARTPLAIWMGQPFQWIIHLRLDRRIFRNKTRKLARLSIRSRSKQMGCINRLRARLSWERSLVERLQSNNASLGMVSFMFD